MSTTIKSAEISSTPAPELASIVFLLRANNASTKRSLPSHLSVLWPVRSSEAERFEHEQQQIWLFEKVAVDQDLGLKNGLALSLMPHISRTRSQIIQIGLKAIHRMRDAFSASQRYLEGFLEPSDILTIRKNGSPPGLRRARA